MHLFRWPALMYPNNMGIKLLQALIRLTDNRVCDELYARAIRYI